MNFIERQLGEIFGGTWYTLYNTDDTLDVRVIDGVFGDFETTVLTCSEKLITILLVAKEYVHSNGKETNMNKIKIKYEVEKELKLPKVNYVHGSCVSNSDIDCNKVECEDCFFNFNNYKTLLEQEKGE